MFCFKPKIPFEKVVERYGVAFSRRAWRVRRVSGLALEGLSWTDWIETSVATASSS
jgi:hypothetical protein